MQLSDHDMPLKTRFISLILQLENVQLKLHWCLFNRSTISWRDVSLPNAK